MTSQSEFEQSWSHEYVQYSNSQSALFNCSELTLFLILEIFSLTRAKRSVNDVDCVVSVKLSKHMIAVIFINNPL